MQVPYPLNSPAQILLLISVLPKPPGTEMMFNSPLKYGINSSTPWLQNIQRPVLKHLSQKLTTYWNWFYPGLKHERSLYSPIYAYRNANCLAKSLALTKLPVGVCWVSAGGHIPSMACSLSRTLSRAIACLAWPPPAARPLPVCRRLWFCVWCFSPVLQLKDRD